MNSFGLNSNNFLLLLQSLERNYSSDKSITEQIQKQYVSSPWETIYEKKSWMGRIALWLRYPSEKATSEKNTIKAFITIFKEVYNNAELFKRVGPEFGKNLIKEFHTELDLGASLNPDLFPNPEFSYFEQLKRKNDEISQAKIEEHSLLPLVDTRNEVLSIEQFKKIFSGEEEICEETFTLIESYFKKHPELAVPDWEVRLEKIRKGHRERIRLQQTIPLQGLLPSENDKRNKARELGQSVLEKIGALNPGESYQFNGSYGASQLTLESLFHSLSYLPTSLRSEFPKEIVSESGKSELLDPTKFVEDSIHKFIEHLDEFSPNLAETFQSLPIGGLFPDSNRELNSWCHHFLPQILSAYIEEFIKEGLIKDTTAVFGSAELRMIAGWLVGKGKEIYESDGQKSFTDALETELQALGTHATTKFLGVFNTYLRDFSAGLKKFLPPALFDLLGLENFAYSGPLWYKITKSQDGQSFDLEIYTLGNAIGCHTIIGTDLVSFPLRMEGLLAEELSEELFERIFYHYITPREDPSIPLSIKNLYEGTFQPLLQKRVNAELKFQSEVAQLPSNDLELTLSLLFTDEAKANGERFTMQVEVFLDLCHSLFKERKLVTEDNEVLQTLLTSAQELEKQARRRFQKEEEKVKLKAIVATRKEIEKEINRIKGDQSFFNEGEFTLPPQITQEVHRILSENKISKDAIESAKGVLEWAFGEEIGNFVDAILHSYGAQLPAKNSRVESVKLPGPGGVASQTFTSLYLSMLIKGAKYALIAAGLYHIGWTPLLILPATKVLLPYILPKHILDWYYRFQNAVVRSIAQLALHLVLDCLVSKKSRLRLEKLASEWNNSLVHLREQLEGTEKIGYAVELSPPASSLLVELEPEPQILQEAIVEVQPTNPQQAQTNVGRVLLPANFLSIDRNLTITKENLSLFLSQVLDDLHKDSQPLVAVSYIVQQISKLEMPRREGGFWNEVENPESYLPALVDIGCKLRDLTAMYAHQSILHTNEAEIILATHRLLAITDCLVRRTEGWNIEAGTCAYGLLERAVSKTLQFFKPDQKDQLTQLLEYFFPGKDVFALRKRELKELNEATLFNATLYDDMTFFGINGLRIPEFFDISGFGDTSKLPFVKRPETLYPLVKNPELLYLNKLLADPANLPKIEAICERGDKEEGPIARLDLFRVLLEESAHFGRSDPIIPLPYQYLRLQTLMTIQTSYLEPCKHSVTDLFKSLGKYAVKKRSWLKYMGFSSHRVPPPESLKYAYLPNVYRLIKKRKTQSTQMEFSFQNRSTGDRLNENDSRIISFGYISVEDKDTVLRLIEWMRTYKEYFDSGDNYRASCAEYLFDSSQVLTEQLLNSPLSCLAINRFFAEMIEYYTHSQKSNMALWFIYAGIRVQRFIEDAAPEYLDSCPNFFLLLEKLKTPEFDSDWEQVLILQALSFESAWKKEGGAKVEAAKALCLALLTNNYSKNFSYVFDFQKLCNLYLNDVIQLLQVEESRNEILNGILEEYGIPLPINSSWQMSNKMEYRNGNIILVDFDREIIEVDGAYYRRERKPSLEELLNGSELAPLKRLFSDREFIPTEAGFVSKDGIYTIESSPALKVFRLIDGVQYQKSIPSPSLVQGPTFKLTGMEGSEQLIQWSETGNLTGKMCIQRLDRLDELHFFLWDPASDHFQYLEGNNHDAPVTRVPLNALKKHQLTSLTRFCSLDQIECLVDVKRNLIRYFNITSYNLSFDVKTSESGISRASCLDKDFVGYELATVQNHEALKSINSYLILENNGQKIVLIPTGLRLFSPLWKVASSLGPLGKILTAGLHPGVDETTKKKYHAYQINEKGELVSSDPQAVAYLITLHLLQGNIKGSVQSIKLLELQLNSQPVDTDVILEELLPIIFLPPTFENISYLRLRLLSAIERNRLVQLSPKSKTPTKEDREKKKEENQLNHQDLFILSFFIDYNNYLYHPHSTLQLSDGEEYFLFKYFTTTIQKHIDTVTGENNTVKTLIMKYGPFPFSENFLFSPKMKERWELVKKKYKLDELPGSSAYRWIKKVGKGFAPSTESLEALDEAQMFEGLSSRLSTLVHSIKFVTQPFRNWNALYETLHVNLVTKIVLPPLDSQQFNSENLIKYFSCYFALAREEFGDEQSQQKLRHLLLLNQGGWDENSAHLINLLQAATYKDSAFTVEKLIFAARETISPYHSQLLEQLDLLKKSIQKHELRLKDLNQEIEKNKQKLLEPRDRLLGQILQQRVQLDMLKIECTFPEGSTRQSIQKEIQALDTRIEEKKKAITKELSLRKDHSQLAKELGELVTQRVDAEKKLEIIALEEEINAAKEKNSQYNKRIENYKIQADEMLEKITSKHNAAKSRVTSKRQQILKLLRDNAAQSKPESPTKDNWFQFFDDLTKKMETRKIGGSLFYATTHNAAWVAEAYCQSQGVDWLAPYAKAATEFAMAPKEMSSVTFTRENFKKFKESITKKLIEGPEKEEESHFANLEKYYEFAQGLFSSTEPEKEEKTTFDYQYTPPSYSPLESEEAIFNNELKTQFDLLFEERDVPVNEEQIDHFEYKGEEPLYKTYFSKVNDSIDTFYQNRSPTSKEIKVKSLDALTQVYRNLVEMKEKLQTQLEQDKRKLIEGFAEINRQRQHVDTITLDDLWEFIDSYQGNDVYTKKATVEQVQLLDFALMKYAHRQSRLNQFKHAVAELDRLIEVKGSQPLDKLDQEQVNFIEGQLELIADILLAKTMFSFTETPIEYLRSFLRFQSNSGKMMWKRQVQRLRLQLKEENNNSMNKQACSDGKTSVGIPNAIQIKADGDNLVFVVAPQQVSGTLFNVISGLIGDLYSKRSFRNHHERQLQLDAEKLEALYVVLETARKSKTPVFLTKEDIKSLYAIWIDKLHHYIHVSKKNNGEEKKCLLLLQQILKLIKTKGFAIIDEAHDVYDQSKKLNLPVGSPQTISQSYFSATKSCFTFLCQTEFLDYVQKNELYKLNENAYKETILPQVAKQLAASFKVTDESHVDEFVKFFTNEFETIPDVLSKHPKYKDICLCKGVLTILIEDIRTQENRASVDYGPSKKGRGEFARPYEGNSSPQEVATIQDPYETLVKTFLSILGTGLNQLQAKDLFCLLLARAEAEMKKREVPCTETRIFKIFYNEKDKEANEKIKKALLNPSGTHNWEEIAAIVNAIPEAQFIYIREFIWKGIEYWNLSIQVNSQTFANLVPCQHAGTATPYNEGTYATHVNILDDPETIGESLHTIISKCPDANINIVKKAAQDEELTPKAILNKILDTYLTDPLCSMIIDGGALFTGLTAEEVAREMLRHAKTHRTDIEHVKFFKKDEQDVDQIYMLSDPNGVPVLAEKCKHSSKACLTFIDHPHGLAANIPQKNPGYAVETFGPMHPLYRQVQESFRELRDPKKVGQLEPLVEKYRQDRSQGIRFVTTEEIAEKINSVTGAEAGSIPTIHQAFEYGIFNEAKLVARENWDSMRPKINVIPHQVIYNKMLNSDFDTLINLYEEFEEKVFLTPLETRPDHLYPFLPVEVKRMDALKAYSGHVVKKFKSSKGLSREEKRTIKKQIKTIPQPELQPEMVTAYQAEGGSKGLKIDLFDQLNQRLHSYQQQENEVKETVEEKVHLKLKQNVAVQQSDMEYHYDERPWPIEATLDSLEWLTLVSPESCVLGKKENCPFFSLQETLKESDTKELAKISKDFDTMLWYPNNWLPRWVDSSTNPVSIGTFFQRNLYEVLIHIEETETGTKIHRMAPLSQHDAAIWREKMKQAIQQDPDYWDKQPIKIFLWDVANRTVAAGYQPPDIKTFKKNSRFKQGIVSLKFLNGDVNYKYHMKTLQKWFEKSHNPRLLVEAFRLIHKRRGTQKLEGSDMDLIISQFTPETY